MTTQTNAILKPAGKFFNVYLLNVPVYYAVVHKPKKKYQSDAEEYCLTAFVDTETRDKLESEFKLNKELHEVGRDKNKKKEIKYKLQKQLKDGEKTSYDDVAGLHGIQVAVDVVDKNGYKHVVDVIDKDGKPFTEDLGNGTVCNVKLFAYKNQEDMLIVSLNTVQVIEHVPYEGGSGNNGGIVTDDVLGVSYEATATTKVEDAVTSGEAGEPTNSPQQPATQAEDPFADFDDEPAF